MRILIVGLMVLLSTSAMNQNFEEINSAIHTRTSVRHYTSQKVEATKVEALLRAAMAAPSSRNVQPWRFYVIEDPEKLQELAQKLPTAGMLARAPLAILVCGDSTAGNPSEEQKQNWIMDCSAATQNILLLAHSMGLGAVWTGVFPYQARIQILQHALDIPSHIIPLSLIPIGYPLEINQAKDKWDKEKVHWEPLKD